MQIFLAVFCVMGHIGKNIKKIRNVKGLSQQAFAELFDLTRGNISSYEEMRAEPKIEVVLQIAKYFSIPLEQLIQKDLSVNELLNFNTAVVIDPERFALTQKIVNIPLVSGSYMAEYLVNFDNLEYLEQLPHISIPFNATKQRLIAVEIVNPDLLPLDFNASNGDILIFEKVEVENIHRILDKLAMIVNQTEIHFGVYKQMSDEIKIVLNEFVHYPFNIDSEEQFWVVKAIYSQSI